MHTKRLLFIVSLKKNFILKCTPKQFYQEVFGLRVVMQYLIREFYDVLHKLNFTMQSVFIGVV